MSYDYIRCSNLRITGRRRIITVKIRPGFNREPVKPVTTPAAMEVTVCSLRVGLPLNGSMAA